jgi:hypothetical protein
MPEAYATTWWPGGQMPGPEESAKLFFTPAAVLLGYISSADFIGARVKNLKDAVI